MPSQFDKVLTEAVHALVDKGFTSQTQIDEWMGKLRAAARMELLPERLMKERLRTELEYRYRKGTAKARLGKVHPGVSVFDLNRIKPELRAELDRRILASANLITLNRQESIERTLRRFAGWSTSIPKGGTEVAKIREVKTDIRKGFTKIPYEERRVVIDQGNKLVAAIDEIIAHESGAIAAIWHSHWREKNYDYRPEHKARDEEIFVVRDNWALEKGYMKLYGHKYTDEIDAPAQLPYCGCYYSWLNSPDSLPKEMQTKKWRDAMKATSYRFR